jgi:hypothetical protein
MLLAEEFLRLFSFKHYAGFSLKIKVPHRITIFLATEAIVPVRLVLNVLNQRFMEQNHGVPFENNARAPFVPL